MAEGRGSPSDATRRAVLNTAPPGQAGRWREGETSSQPSGVERGSTLASSVAAPGVCGRTSQFTRRRRVNLDLVTHLVRRSGAIDGSGERLTVKSTGFHIGETWTWH
jgi:hypothetical protein